MSEKEPDETPVRREHVETFLKWYRAQCTVPPYTGIDEHWFNALHTLKLGELRDGMRWYGQLTTRPYLAPAQFWTVCKSPRNATRDKLFKQMRDGLKSAPRRDKGDE